MNYLRREHPRRTHPQDLLPEAQSVIVVTAAYYDGDHDPTRNAGKVARYAWGKDYHSTLREKLNELGAWIKSRAADYGVVGPVLHRGHTDSAPLDERSLAVRAGLGFIGKNTLLLHPEHGSWSLLGVLLTSVPFSSDEASGGTCGSCRKCLEACPTDAFDGPYELDPRRCTSYLTIEQSDPIAPELAAKMSGWAFGCDICQEVCPLNAKPLTLRLSDLRAENGVGPHVTEEIWSGIESKKAFVRRWEHTPLSRPGLDSMKRNLAAANRTIHTDSTDLDS